MEITVNKLNKMYECKGKTSKMLRSWLVRLGYLSKGERLRYNILMTPLPNSVKMLTKEVNEKIYTFPPADIFESAKSDLEGLKDEVEEWYDGMGQSEGLSQTAKYEELEEATNGLTQAMDYLENYEEFTMHNLPIVLNTYAYEQSSSRQSRLDLVCVKLSALIDEEVSESDGEDCLTSAVEEIESIAIPGMYQ